MWWGVGYSRSGQGWVGAGWGPCEMTLGERAVYRTAHPRRNSELLQVRVGSLPGRGQLMVGHRCWAGGLSLEQVRLGF